MENIKMISITNLLEFNYSSKEKSLYKPKEPQKKGNPSIDNTDEADAITDTDAQFASSGKYAM